MSPKTKKILLCVVLLCSFLYTAFSSSPNALKRWTIGAYIGDAVIVAVWYAVRAARRRRRQALTLR